MAENIIDKVAKAKNSFRRIGYLMTHGKQEVLDLLKKYNIVPDKNNQGQIVKAIFATIKGNDQFTADLAALLAKTNPTAKSIAKKPAVAKTSSYDGTDESVLQIAQDLKEASDVLTPEDASAQVDLAKKEVNAEKSEKMLKYILIGIVVLALAVIAYNHFKK